MKKLLNEFFERVKYEGYTYEEAAQAAGGGGKMGGGQTYAPPPPVQTTNNIGSQLDAPSETYEDDTIVENDTQKKRKGTRGLQIPLATDKSTTNKSTGIGVQL